MVGTAVKTEGTMNFTLNPPYFSIASISDIKIIQEKPKISRAEALKGFRLIKRAAEND